MKNTEFKEWLENKLKESPSKHYDPNGNSSRAVVSRGRWKEIIYQYKKWTKIAIREIKSFRGLDTPISYFVSLVIILLFSPIIPIVWSYYSYSLAIEDYKSIFEAEKKEK